MYINDINSGQSLVHLSLGEAQAPLSPSRTEDTPHGATDLQQTARVRWQAGPILPAPLQPLDGVKLNQACSDVVETLNMMSLLFQLARQAREMGLLQRDMDNLQVIDSQKAQVDEMRHGARLMIAMAVISGALTFVSAIMGAYSLGKGAMAIKQQQALDTRIAGREALVDAKMEALGKQGVAADRDAISKVWKQGQTDDTISRNLLDKQFSRYAERGQLLNTVIQFVGQTTNSAVQVAQGESQAMAKQDEVNATISQTEKQKVEDNMSFNVNFMREVLQLMQQYSQSQNQAWKAAFGVV
ncbi:MAG: YopD family type III secretion system translocon subunit [Aeromonas sp.]